MKQHSPISALLTRDIRLSARKGAQSLLPLVFLVAVIAMVPLGIGPGPDLLAKIAPGMIWVAAFLAGLLALDGLFRPDLIDGSLEQWWVGNQPVVMLVATRLFSHWCVSALPLILFTPIAAQMLYLPNEVLSLMMLTLVLGTPILSLVGGLGAALTLGARGSSALLGILVFPFAVPVLIFGTGAVSTAVDGLSSKPFLLLLSALLLLSITLVPLATASALKLSIE